MKKIEELDIYVIAGTMADLIWDICLTKPGGI